MAVEIDVIERALVAEIKWTEGHGSTPYYKGRAGALGFALRLVREEGYAKGVLDMYGVVDD